MTIVCECGILLHVFSLGAPKPLVEVATMMPQAPTPPASSPPVVSPAVVGLPRCRRPVPLAFSIVVDPLLAVSPGAACLPCRRCLSPISFLRYKIAYFEKL